MKINLGTTAKPLMVDLTNLLETRMLIQSNSGGGKSWAVRKLLEESHGKVQQIVLDRDGEFVTLREKFDYIIAGADGDIPAIPRHAGLMARKILELEASIIIDLFELKVDQRQLFVKNFLEAMVDAPKKLWHSVLLLVDEAHTFCPQKTKSISTDAVINMASLGRKRGFCQVLATQRLAKLNKDAVAECINKMIGRTSFMDDAKRATEELGFPTKDFPILRTMKPGEWFVFGPSISDEVIRTKIGPVKSHHPKAGERIGVVTPAPKGKIKAVLAKLADLPQQSETEIKNLAQAKAKMTDLERQLRMAKTAQPKPPPAPKGPSLSDLKKAEDRGFDQGVQTSRQQFVMAMANVPGQLKEAGGLITKAVQIIGKASDVKMARPIKELPKPNHPGPIMTIRKPSPVAPSNGGGQTDDVPLGRCERAILGFLISYPGREFSKAQTGVMSGYSYGSGSFNSAVARLNVLGFVERIGADLVATDKARTESGVTPKVIGLESWMSRLGKCEKSIFQVLRDSGEEMPKDVVGESTGYSAASGSFNSAVARLNTLGLIKRNGNGTLVVNPEISDL